VSGVAQRFPERACCRVLHETLDIAPAGRRQEPAFIVAHGAAQCPEKVAPACSTSGDFTERFFYAASVPACLPCGMSEQPLAQTGAVLRESKMAESALRAGFPVFENLGLEHASMNCYRLRP